MQQGKGGWGEQALPRLPPSTWCPSGRQRIVHKTLPAADMLLRMIIKIHSGTAKDGARKVCPRLFGKHTSQEAQNNQPQAPNHTTSHCEM